MFRKLIRQNKKLPSAECERLLKEIKRGVLSVQGEDDYPYGTPMNHYYDEDSGKIYFHSGNIGHRLDSLKRSDKVSFCVCDEGRKLPDHWAYEVKSVIVFGRVKIVEDREKVANVARKLSHKFTQDEEYIENEIKNHLSRTVLLELTPENVCGKVVVES